ncbi:MAG: S9 family peptidase [Bacteroidaceae bacterium]|nr:S9 family peptidase [Bacteroidaceae bacterium]
MGMAGLAMLSACNSQETTQENVIGKQEIAIENGIMTPEVMMAFGRVSSPTVSPDGTKVMYSVQYVDYKANRGNSELFVAPIDGTPTQITHTPKSEGNATWLDDNTIAFTYPDANGLPQVWRSNADGTGRKQLSNMEQGVEGFLFSPDHSQVILIATVSLHNKAVDKYADLPQATGRVIDDLMYKHWDEWTEAIPHPFIAQYDGNKIVNPKDILEGEPYEAPMRPFGGAESFAWTPDGKSIIYTCRKKTGIEYSLSTNSDLYRYDLTEGTTENLTEGMMGYDTNPVISPDGRYMAWTSMERDGYESDKNRLFVLDLTTGEKRYLTEQFDYIVNTFAWDNDSQKIYFTSPYKGMVHVFGIRLDNLDIEQITEGYYDYAAVYPAANNKLVTMRHSLSQPDEICIVDLATRQVSDLSRENETLLAEIEMGRVEERWIPTTDGKKMLAWVVYPPHFDANKKYPAILYCQGGPQSPVSQFWSYRWNLQLIAAQGYIIVAPNRRGLPGFGQEWLEQISKDYGGQNMRDYLAAADAIKAEPYVDKMGAVGASYGGFSVYWLAGHHEKRFDAFIAHAGIFNLEQQYMETEEMWFANWDMGGAPWDKNNAIAQRTFANSPHRFVGQWDTPILCIHGEKDFRILASQGMSAFNAAKLRGIPAELLVFPDENHWILKPQNGLLFHRTFIGWLDRWLKPAE